MLDKKIAISVQDVHKTFVLPQHKSTTFKQMFVNAVKKNKKVQQKVLDGINFDIYEGEFFGIVGRNGSGKSTLLKLLAGIYAPDRGEITINGQLTPFIELGVGFSPELSGRDNVYLNAALLGFTRKQTEAMYDDIVEFAELEEHMDKKLKNYSSGMQVRLAFSIAVKAKNDILIFDEVLAVGDEAFQRKCMEVFREYRRNKQTVVLVTHSMENVKNLCTRAMMLSDGKIEVMGSVKKVANAYLRSNMTGDESEKRIDGSVKKSRVTVAGCQEMYHHNDTMKLQIQWPEEYPVAKVGIAIFGYNGEYVFGSNSGDIPISREGMDYEVKLNLGPGQYTVTVGLNDAEGKSLELVNRVASFAIYDEFDAKVNGLTRMDYKYSPSRPDKKM